MVSIATIFPARQFNKSRRCVEDWSKMSAELGCFQLNENQCPSSVLAQGENIQPISNSPYFLHRSFAVPSVRDTDRPHEQFAPKQTGQLPGGSQIMLLSIKIHPTCSIQDTIIREFGLRVSFFTIRGNIYSLSSFFTISLALSFSGLSSRDFL
jgi:hypothetical protein